MKTPPLLLSYLEAAHGVMVVGSARKHEVRLRRLGHGAFLARVGHGEPVDRPVGIDATGRRKAQGVVGAILGRLTRMGVAHDLELVRGIAPVAVLEPR